MNHFHSLGESRWSCLFSIYLSSLDRMTPHAGERHSSLVGKLISGRKLFIFEEQCFKINSES